MALSPDDVAALARLARIELTDEELAHLAPQLDVILESVASVVRRRRRRHPADLPRAAADQRVPRGRGPSVAAAWPTCWPARRPPSRTGSGSRRSWGRRDDATSTQEDRRRPRRRPSPPARSSSVEVTRRTWTGSPPSTATCTRSCTSTASGRWPRPRGRRPPGAGGETARPAGRGAAGAQGHRRLHAARRRPAARRSCEGWIPPYDATVTRRLLDAGMVILGKTNLDEFAMGSSTENSAYGPTRNPWDLTRIPGGSGGGSAAALAAFEAPLAIGTDTGGSIRQPAAVTGTVGVKPTYGGVSRYGVVAWRPRWTRPGPCARTVLDAALLHEVIAGHDPLDSTSITRRCRRWSRRPRVRRRRPACRSAWSSELERRGLRARGRAALPRGRRAAGLASAPRSSRSYCPHFHYALARLLPDPAQRVLLQPGQVRRHAVRAAGRRRRQPQRRAGDGADPGGRLRRRGQAPDHPRHLRAVQRLLRRLLRLGAEGPHADQPRLRRRPSTPSTCWSRRPRR